MNVEDLLPLLRRVPYPKAVVFSGTRWRWLGPAHRISKSLYDHRLRPLDRARHAARGPGRAFRWARFEEAE